MSSPFTTKLYAPSGSPDGIIVAIRDDWTGRAIIFPRELVGEVKGRKEYSEPGVYLLVSARKMYIGEGDPVGSRIDNHATNKDFWRRGLIFSAEGRRLNKAHIQHLESRLVSIAKQANRVELDNGNHPKPPVLSEEEYAFCESFLQQMLLTLPLLGFWQFRNDSDADEVDQANEAGLEEDSLIETSMGKRALLYSSLPQGLNFSLHTMGIHASLELTESGVIVKAGSQVRDPVTENFELNAPNYAAQRRQLIESGVIELQNGSLVFTKDQFFSSGSAASAVVRGGVSNSEWWKDGSGKSLGEYIREAKSRQ